MRAFLLVLLLLSTPAFAGVEQLSREEFESLARELAPRVSLFRDVWEKDPGAQFYGGTTRDFLYWVKGKFKDAKTPGDARVVAAKLRALPVIDVRDFIYGESDVDLFTDAGHSLRAEDYGVRKIDRQSPAALDPTTELGKNEIHQGFVPAEKIRLGKDGFAKPDALGDGLGEIYSGHLTVHFAPPEAFAETKYAKEGMNHPILLAVRYLRLQAIDYFQTHGQTLPSRAKLLAGIDSASAEGVRAVIAGTLDGKELRPFLKQPKFQSWLNGAIQKAFRSYTNPDAAKVLMEEFGVTQLPNVYPEVAAVNQYVFRQYRDPAKISANLARFGVKEDSFFLDPARAFPDGFLYHGTKEESAFRSILLQGVLGSSGGSAGEGLYGVSNAHQDFAEKWGGDKDRLVRFPVEPHAKVVDITRGEGARVWRDFAAAHPGPGAYEAFAEAFGVDILGYPYTPPAFVVKNSAALGRGQGVHRQILTLGELLDRVKTLRGPAELFSLAEMNNLRRDEVQVLLREANFKVAELEALAHEPKTMTPFLRYVLSSPEWAHREDLAREVFRDILQRDHANFLRPLTQAFLTELLGSPAWREKDEFLAECARLFPQSAYWYRDFVMPGDAPVNPTLYRELANRDGLNSFLNAAVEGVRHGDGAKWAGHEDLVLDLMSRRDPFRPDVAADRTFALLLRKPVFAGRRDLAERYLAAGDPEPFTTSVLTSEAWHRADPAAYEDLLARVRPRVADAALFEVLVQPFNGGRRDLFHELLARGKVDGAFITRMLGRQPWAHVQRKILTALRERPVVEQQFFPHLVDLVPGPDGDLAKEVLLKNVNQLTTDGFEYLLLHTKDWPSTLKETESFEEAVDRSLLVGLNAVNEGKKNFADFQRQVSYIGTQKIWEGRLKAWAEGESTEVKRQALGNLFALKVDPLRWKPLTAERLLKNPAVDAELRSIAKDAIRDFFRNTLAGAAAHTDYELLYRALGAAPDLLREPEAEPLLEIWFQRFAKNDRYLQAYPALLLRRLGKETPESAALLAAYAKGTHLETEGHPLARGYEEEIFPLVEKELAQLKLPAECPGRFGAIARGP